MERATAQTDFVYELVDAESGQGEGHHAFAGLTAPLLPVARGLRQAGQVTTGWNARVLSSALKGEQLQLHLQVHQGGTQGMLIHWPDHQGDALQGLPVNSRCERHDNGMWSVVLQLEAGAYEWILGSP